jgi:hypothetical protein
MALLLHFTQEGEDSTPVRGALYEPPALSWESVGPRLSHDTATQRDFPLQRLFSILVATVASSLTYHEYNHDLKYDLIDYIGILPCDDIRLPLQLLAQQV